MSQAIIEKLDAIEAKQSESIAAVEAKIPAAVEAVKAEFSELVSSLEAKVASIQAPAVLKPLAKTSCVGRLPCPMKNAKSCWSLRPRVLLNSKPFALF